MSWVPPRCRAGCDAAFGLAILGLLACAPGPAYPDSHSQKPWGDPSPITRHAEPQASADDGAGERVLFEKALLSNAPEDYRAYIAAFPNGEFADLARDGLIALGEESAVMRSEASFSSMQIEELLTLPPLFPPIEGLPEELWKDAPCASCHSWDIETLCAQGERYGDERLEVGTEDHPFGGILRLKLKELATGGCQ